MKTRILILFFAIAIVLAKVISNMEIGFLVAVTLMAVGAIAVEKQKSLGSGFVLTGTISLLFNIFSVPLPPQVIFVAYFIIALLGLVMALAIIVIMAEKEKTEVETETEFGYMPERRKAVTA